MAIAIGGFNALDGGNATSVTVNKPSGLSNGDILVLAVYVDGVDSVTTWPTGFSTEYSQTASGYYFFARIGIKIITDAGSEPSSYTVSWSGSQYCGAFLGRASGVDTADLLSATTGSSTGNSNTISTPSITTDTNDSVVLAITWNFNWRLMSTPTDTTIWGSTESGGFESVQLNYFTVATAGASGAKTSSISSTSRWTGVQLALKPAAAAAGDSITRLQGALRRQRAPLVRM